MAIKSRGHHLLVARLCIILISLMAFSMIVDAGKLQQTGTTFWLPTKYRVEVGVIQGNIDFSIKSPCRFIDFKEPERYTLENMDDIAYSSLYHRCEKEYQDSILSTFTKLANCMPQSANPRRIKRVKRFEPITTAIIGIVILSVLVVSAVVSVGYMYLAEGSDYNRINRLEEREKSREEKISNLEKQLISSQLVRGETIDFAHNISKRVDANRNAIIGAAKKQPTIAWDAASLRLHIDKHNSYLQEIYYSCTKRHLNTKAFKRLANITDLEDVEPGDTQLDHVQILNAETINFQFIQRIESRDTKIYEVASFTHWTNYTEEPVLVEYKGPAYVIHNSTSNCTKEVKNPANRIYTACTEQNYLDPRLNDWGVVKDPKVADSPVIYKHEVSTIIYCLYHQIEIDGINVWCPPYPFALPITSNFKLGNTTHRIEAVIHKLHEHPLVLHRNKSDWIPSESDSQAYSSYIALKKLNDQSLQAGQLNVQKGTLTVPLDMYSALASIGFIASIITIITCVSRCTSCGGLAKATTDTHAETINIYSSIPNLATSPAAEEIQASRFSTRHGKKPQLPPRTPREERIQSILTSAMMEARKYADDEVYSA